MELTKTHLDEWQAAWEDGHDIPEAVMKALFDYAWRYLDLQD